jgi:hypothetical protein
MPAGTHEVLDQTREAVERRARILVAQLQEFGDDPVKAVNKEETTVAANVAGCCKEKVSR